MSNLLWIVCLLCTLCVRRVLSAQMTLQPPVVDLSASGQAPEVTMTCEMSPNETTASIQSINLVRIARNRVVDQRSYFVNIAMQIAGMQAALVGQDQDVIDRSPAVSGSIQVGNSVTPHHADVKLVWPAGAIQCTDEGQYQCEISYLDSTFHNHIVHAVSTLHVKSPPPTLHLGAIVNGTLLTPTEGTLSNKVQVKVGDTVIVTCKGNVGQDPNGTIDWYYTNPLDTRDRFQLFFPGPGDDIYDSATAFSQSACAYERNSTLRYVVREEDVARKDDLAFECGTTLTQANNQQLLTNSDRRLYIEALPLPTTTSATTTNTTPTTTPTTTTTTEVTTTPTTPPTPPPTTKAPTTVVVTTPMPTTQQITTTAAPTLARGGPYCLSCKNVIQPRHCHAVAHCLPDQVCGTKRVLDQFGDVYYDVGCMNINSCHVAVGKREPACTECCDTDLCNAVGCGQPGYPDTFGPVCFTCGMLPTGRSCHTVTACQKHETCFIEQVDEFGDILVHRGCRAQQTCHELSSSNPVFIGKRSVLYGGGSTCSHCCSGALCNDDCATTADTPTTTLATPPHTAAMTTAPVIVASSPTAPVIVASTTPDVIVASSTPVVITAPPDITTMQVTTTASAMTPTETAVISTTSDCFDVLKADECMFVIQNIPNVCSNYSTARDGGCLASCGFCNVSRTTVVTTPSTSVAATPTSDPGIIVFRDCLDIHRAIPAAGSGEYSVTVTSADGSPKTLSVWCDMANGGGWTVFQKRFNGSLDFYKGFRSYEQGFGNVNGEFWLGLEHIHQMTAGSANTLRVDVVDSAGNRTYEEYGNFSVDQSPLYTLHIGGARNGTADGKLDAFNGGAFSASNKDQDVLPNSACATRYHGCFWYKDCTQVSNPNGLYKPGPDANCLFHAMTYGNCDGNKAIEFKFRRNA